MACYNTREYVTHAVESLVKQTVSPNHILILDDASGDGSWQTLQQLAQHHASINLYRNQNNQGIARTRNTLLANMPSQTDYVVILDSDDVAHPQAVERQLAFLREHPDVAGCSGAIEIINQEGRLLGTQTHRVGSSPSRCLGQWNPHPQVMLMIRWSVWQQVGEYDETLVRGEDYDLWFRFYQAGHPLALTSHLVGQYRLHASQGKWQHSRQSMRDYARVRRRYIFSSQFFSLKAVLIILGYYLVSLIPGWVVVWLYRRYYVHSTSA